MNQQTAVNAYAASRGLPALHCAHALLEILDTRPLCPVRLRKTMTRLFLHCAALADDRECIGALAMVRNRVTAFLEERAARLDAGRFLHSARIPLLRLTHRLSALQL